MPILVHRYVARVTHRTVVDYLARVGTRGRAPHPRTRRPLALEARVLVDGDGSVVLKAQQAEASVRPLSTPLC